AHDRTDQRFVMREATNSAQKCRKPHPDSRDSQNAGIRMGAFAKILQNYLKSAKVIKVLMQQEVNMAQNPFTPGFGQIPPYLAGREYVIRDASNALSAEGHNPNLTTLFVGARGTGKTTLLNLVAENAKSRGWIAAQVSAVPGMLDDILITAQRAARHLAVTTLQAHLTPKGMAGASLGWEKAPAQTGNWRSNVTDLLDSLKDTNTGLLITVDDLSILDALESTVTSAGRSISPDALNEAVDAIEGSPYMMQLVGYLMWNAHPNVPTIGRHWTTFAGNSWIRAARLA
ncbi:MAG: ATP-binding protein, partial [Coriobacteriales bacterium]|nr:ATP-binding protein [Coriobacteriales bacterium]